MGIEIERKFLVIGESWRANDPVGTRFCQGYLANGQTTVRIRWAGGSACITIKGKRHGISRPEFEYLIPVEDAEELFQLCRKPLIEKIRYAVRDGEHIWSVDVFGGRNRGLVLAEIELQDSEEAFSRPDWLGREVSDNMRYRNSSLVIAPIDNPLLLSLAPRS